jgi:hypothetical protein
MPTRTLIFVLSGSNGMHFTLNPENRRKKTRKDGKPRILPISAETQASFKRSQPDLRKENMKRSEPTQIVVR